MTIFEVPPFDGLSGGKEPSDCLGEILIGTAHDKAMRNLMELGIEADKAVQEIFRRKLLVENNIIYLDDIIAEMWRTGWNPNVNNTKLFTLHFGVLLTLSMLSMKGVQPIFRSDVVCDHVSVWHKYSNTEYFPFHKIIKCLTEHDGESAAQMYRDLQRKALGEQSASAGGGAFAPPRR